jgi:hypothetical protein
MHRSKRKNEATRRVMVTKYRSDPISSTSPNKEDISDFNLGICTLYKWQGKIPMAYIKLSINHFLHPAMYHALIKDLFYCAECKCCFD